jgi:hypothetical protein
MITCGPAKRSRMTHTTYKDVSDPDFILGLNRRPR